VSKYETKERRLDLIEFIAIARAMGSNEFDLLRAISNALPKRIEIQPSFRGIVCYNSMLGLLKQIAMLGTKYLLISGLSSCGAWPKKSGQAPNF
jgi:hypothetical protein